MAAAYELNELAVAKETALKAQKGREAGMSAQIAGHTGDIARPSGATAADPASPALIPNPQSQWMFGATLTIEEILQRLGSKSRQAHGWNIRRGQHHSGYFWPQPDGRVNPDGYTETNPSVGSMGPKDFIPLTVSATKAPPPTNHETPEAFSSRNIA